MRRNAAQLSRDVRRALILAASLCAVASRAQSPVTNTYTTLADDIANPERGFYLHTETRSSAHRPVPANLANLRINGSRDPNNAYIARITLVLRVIYLDSFIDAPISSNYLATIAADFDSIRNQGAKAIVRFAYFQTASRPFPEPTKARILEHIGQLTPLLRANRDVIALLQQGFIGAWGEGYYTDVFSTAGLTFTAQNWRDRAEVIQALLDALPPERMVQVRVPQQRQKFLHGPAAPTSTNDFSTSTPFSGNAASRLGFHNDCFLADATDAGTFSDYDGATDAQDTATLRTYMANATRFTVMGGETCLENAPADNCESAGGRADGDLGLFHYSFLNQGYNANVNDDWATQGCMEDIKRRLGYRLRLISTAFPADAQPGQLVPFRIELRNDGYAVPFNPRGLEIILRHSGSGQKYFAELSRDIDARLWLPGTNHSIVTTLSVPTNMPTGSYEILFHLPDPEPSLYGLPHYAIRLANATVEGPDGSSLGGIWEPTTGYNRLGHFLTISGAPTDSPALDSEIPLLPYSAVRENYEAWRARHFPVDSPDGEATADPDADNWENLAEYASGTDPHSNAQRPAPARFEDGKLILSLAKAPGVKDVSYEFESSTNLFPAEWTTGGVTVLENTPTVLRVQLESPTSSVFVRIRTRPNSP